MRNVEFTFSELKLFLESRGVIFEENEYIRDVTWQMAYPEQIVFVKIDG